MKIKDLKDWKEIEIMDSLLFMAFIAIFLMSIMFFLSMNNSIIKQDTAYEKCINKIKTDKNYDIYLSICQELK